MAYRSYSYRGYVITVDIDDQYCVDIAPGNVLVFATIDEAKRFIDGICAYNEA